MDINITVLVPVSWRPPRLLPEWRDDVLYYSSILFTCIKKIPFTCLIASNTTTRGWQGLDKRAACRKAWKIRTVMAIFIIPSTTVVQDINYVTLLYMSIIIDAKLPKILIIPVFQNGPLMIWKSLLRSWCRWKWEVPARRVWWAEEQSPTDSPAPHSRSAWAAAVSENISAPQSLPCWGRGPREVESFAQYHTANEEWSQGWTQACEIPLIHMPSTEPGVGSQKNTTKSQPSRSSEAALANVLPQPP